MKEKIFLRQVGVFTQCKLGFLVLFFTFFWGISQAHGACQTISFGEGRSFCFDIVKTSSQFYRAEISQRRGDLTDLSCTLKLPNADLVKLSNCVGDFRYNGSYRTIELTANLPYKYFTLVTSYDFSRGTFDAPNSSSNTYSPYSNTENYQYSNFQPDFINVSSERVSRNQWIDATLRVRNTGTSSSYFDGVVDLSVEEWRNGAWRSADASDYRLDWNSVSYSRSEQGEKNLTSFLRFLDDGEFRLVAKIRNSQSRASQTFYVNDETTTHYWSNSYYRSSYTTSEYEKLRAVAEIWTAVISQLRSQYPRLDASSERQRRSDVFYLNMQDVLRGRRNATFSSWSVFYRAFQEWLSFTLQTR